MVIMTYTCLMLIYVLVCLFYRCSGDENNNINLLVVFEHVNKLQILFK